MLSEGQRNDINYAIPLLEQVDIKESDILADRGYDSNKLMDYIYAHGGEPTIPSRKGAKFDRYCDWHLYKERHLVENYFLLNVSLYKATNHNDGQTLLLFWMGSLVLHRESRYNQVIYCYRIHDQLIRCFHWCLHVQAKGLRN